MMSVEVTGAGLGGKRRRGKDTARSSYGSSYGSNSAINSTSNSNSARKWCCAPTYLCARQDVLQLGPVFFPQSRARVCHELRFGKELLCRL